MPTPVEAQAVQHLTELASKYPLANVLIFCIVVSFAVILRFLLRFFEREMDKKDRAYSIVIEESHKRELELVKLLDECNNTVMGQVADLRRVHQEQVVSRLDRLDSRVERIYEQLERNWRLFMGKED